jgi:hypothetical protein
LPHSNSGEGSHTVMAALTATSRRRLEDIYAAELRAYGF